MRDWAGFLALAERLAGEDGDAEHRSAISRAYYSAYNDARRLVRNQDPMFQSADDQHGKVWDWFKGKPGRAGSVANSGNAFRRKRNQADYNVYSPLPFSKHEAEDAVRKAKHILEILADMRAEAAGRR